MNVYMDRYLKGRYLGKYNAPNGRTIIITKVGPNPHEIQHFDAECVEVSDK